MTLIPLPGWSVFFVVPLPVFFFVSFPTNLSGGLWAGLAAPKLLRPLKTKSSADLNGPRVWACDDQITVAENLH